MEDNSKLILGVRRFDADDIPWKSRFGNILTQKVFSYLSGCHVNDTQTGLRGIPIDFVRRLWDIPGERFEFEMRMLMEAAGKIDIEEVAIETIYDSKEHHKTHFRPVKDSIKIYSILAGTLLKYCAASLTSFILDIIAFSALCNILKPLSETLYIILSTILARILSAVCNYFINYRLVFKSENKVKKTGAQYFLLACVQMVVSAVVVDFVSKHLLMNAGEVYIKVLIDMILFFLSYYVQKKYIF